MTQKAENDNTPSFDLIKALTWVIKTIGILCFIVLCLVLFFVWYSDDAQKKEFIDNWFLLKSERHVYCYFIIIGTVAMFVIQNFHFRRLLKMRKDENNRIGQEKSDLQQMLLGNTELKIFTLHP